MSSLEERLRNYAEALDHSTEQRVADLPTRGDALVALVASEPASRHGGMRRIVAVAVAVVVAVVAVATTVAIQRDHRTTSAPPTQATVATTTVVIVPAGEQGLRTLFTRATPDGIVITARAGLVSRADTLGGCPSLPGASTRPAKCPKVPAVAFHYSVSGHEFRVVIFDSETPPPGSPEKLAPMVVVGQVEQVLPDGRAVYWPGVAPYLVVMHATGVAKVRFHPDGAAAGAFEEMAPVSGWVAFIAPDSSIFKNKVAGLDAAGRVVATALPWRCC